MCTEMKKKCALHLGNSRSCVRNTHRQFRAITIVVYKGEQAKEGSVPRIGSNSSRRLSRLRGGDF